MRCPRCTLGDLNEKTHTCVLCGYSAAQPADTVAAVPAAPAAPAAPQTELDARRELAHEFRIERLLEHATTPIAYVARDAEDRALTLKAVPLGQLGAPVDRILAAVDAAARLDHPHIVPIHDSGMTQHFFWYASRYVEGRTLKSILEAAGSIELPVCLRIFEQVASALDYAHRRGVAHEALSLECIVVDANEWVLVGDFGTAGLLAPPPTGSPAAGERAAADQRALATIVRQCLASAEGSGSPAPPLHVSQALRRALSIRTADRFPSVLDFVAALEGGGARPKVQPTWFGAKPRKTPGTPLVIADSDVDPAAPRLRGRVAAALSLAGVLAASAAWLGKSSVPPSVAPASHASTSAPAASSAGPASASAAEAPLAPRDTQRVTLPVASPPPVTASPTASAPLAALGAAPMRVPNAEAPKRTALRPAAPRPAAPRPSPSRAPQATPPPPAPAVEHHAEPALLSVNAIPWGSVYVDGQAMGNTPQIDLVIAPGTHRLRVERDGFRPYERVIEVAPGQRLRITDIALVER
jgi:serine/threonine protein kinase